MNATLEHDRSKLALADPALQALVPLRYEGLLGGGIPTEGTHLAEDIAARLPHLIQPCMIAGREGEDVLPSALLERRGDDGYAILPRLILWPALVPSINGKSLLDQPLIIASPGDQLYARVTWTLAGTIVTSADNGLFFSRDPDLELTNSAPAPSPTMSVTWVHHLGEIDAAGEWQSNPSAFATDPILLPPYPFDN